ncbi:MAG: minichromosome maintenance protein MCM [Candidatus Methanomethyliaceae archaeon]|nr:minichromosome maintenance protein MCM [Candidatus Methanomethyliaceae archaeon]MDD1766522.1 minichromosome maintenance protein MCM [Candidatus Methanomethyliaceae archaeon]
MVEALAEVMDFRERFVNFLKSFQDKKAAYKYREEISQMASQGKTSLVIDFDDLISFDPDLALDLKDKPAEVLSKANEAIYEVMRVENMQYSTKVKNFQARLRKLDEVVPLRALKSTHMGKLTMVEGIVTRSSTIKQHLKVAAFQCPKCGEKMREPQTSTMLIAPQQCSNQDCGRRGFFRLIPEESTFEDWQMISLQERPEELPPGHLPRSVEGVLQGDLVDISRPGDRISLVGTLRAKQEFTAKGYRLATFSTGVEINHIEISEKGAEEVHITPEDEKAIKELAKDPLLYQKIFGSIAPSIYGYEEIKEAIAYQLAGGVTKTMPDGIKIRGDINILLVGDPGTAKSQLLQYIARVAPRGVYTSGKGSTAAGLTATVMRDKNTNEFFLEAGALVIADKGVACIDEIDKMRPEDRSAIHEAMEQQTISIAKAGIVVQLNARSSILAAANPTFGRYVPQRSISENISELPVTIISRFDLIFILIDRPQEARDRDTTEHILRLHRGLKIEKGSMIDPLLLKKYLYYVRTHANPKLSEEASEKIEKFFLEMRGKDEGVDSPVPITMRQLEAVIRLSEARAKLALKKEVGKEDVEPVTKLMKSYLMQVGIDRTTGKADIDMIMVGRPKSASDKLSALFDLLITLEKENEMGPIKREAFITRAEAEGFFRKFTDDTITKWTNDGIIYEPKPGFIKKT